MYASIWLQEKMEEKQYLFRPHVKSYTHVFQICTEVALKLSWTKNEMIFVAYTIFYALICMILWYWYSYFKLFRNIVIVDIHIPESGPSKFWSVYQ